ncbi:MAG: hypothetical protein V1886_01035 [archaeon]
MAERKEILEDIVDEWNDWMKYERKFNDKEGPGPADSELRYKVGKKWFKISPDTCLNSEGKPDPKFLFGKPNDRFHEAIRQGKSLSENIVIEFAKGNLDYIMNEAEKQPEGLYSLAISMPRHKTNNSENDKTRELVSDVMKMNSLYEQDGKPQQTEKMQGYIYSQIKDNKYILNFVAYMMANSPEDTKLIFGRFHEQKAIELQKRFSDASGELSKSKLSGYIKEMADYIKKTELNETDEDIKDDLNDELEAIYKNLAQVAYKTVKED